MKTRNLDSKHTETINLRETLKENVIIVVIYITSYHQQYS